nr:hypothetical protein [Tanacetum cinerariifolium]
MGVMEPMDSVKEPVGFGYIGIFGGAYMGCGGSPRRRITNLGLERETQSLPIDKTPIWLRVGVNMNRHKPGLRVEDSYTGNHPDDDFTPLETIQRSYSVIRERIPFKLKWETFKPERRKVGRVVLRLFDLVKTRLIVVSPTDGATDCANMGMICQRPPAKVVGLRMEDSHTGNHLDDDFTPLETIRRSYSVIRERIPFKLKWETFKPER